MMYPLLSFASFLLWLWLFPMDGKLIQQLHITNAILYFLPFHTVSLLTIFFVKKERFYKVAPFFVILTSILTAGFPFLVKQYQIFLPIMGIFSSAFVIIATLSLKNSKNPVFTALSGFMLASMIQFSLCFISFSNSYTPFFIISFFPLFSLKKITEPEIVFKDEDNCFIYSPFVFFFYMIGGIMYSFIMPQYLKVCIFNGFEILYYMVAIFIGFMLIKIDKVFAIFGGIICGMLAFSLFHADKSSFFNTSMIFLQSAFGFVEIFLIALVISRRESIKAISVIFSSMCLGIVSGTLITLYLKDYSEIIAAYGNISLVVSTTILVVTERRKITNSVMQKDKERMLSNDNLTHDKNDAGLTLNESNLPQNNITSSILPENAYVKALRKRLSQKEFLVLEQILQHKTYKEVAAFLGISESTVKTYVRRIYEKENVKGIDKLLEKIVRATAV